MAALRIAADPNLAAAAEKELKKDFFADKTVEAYSAEVKFYEEKMKAGGLSPWPLNDKKVTKLVSILKVLSYRGAKGYLGAVSTTNQLLGYELDDVGKFAMRMARASVGRNLGPDFTVDPITLNLLNKVVTQSPLSAYRVLVLRLCVVGMFFCLRPGRLVVIKGWRTHY